MKVIPRGSFKRQIWKNGLGHTDEIAIEPPGAELRRADFLWRLSSARIEQSSAFSVFPHHDRVLLVLEGDGLRLSHPFEGVDGPTESMDLPPLEPYEFPGDVSSQCELLGGPITDLSVFVRKGEAEAQVEVAEVGPGETYAWQPGGRWNFAIAARGAFRVGPYELGDPLGAALAPGDACRLDLDLAVPRSPGQPLALRANGDAGGVLILVHITG